MNRDKDVYDKAKGKMISRFKGTKNILQRKMTRKNHEKEEISTDFKSILKKIGKFQKHRKKL